MEAISINWIQGDRFEYLHQIWVFNGNLGGHTMVVYREGEDMKEVVFFPRDSMKHWRKLVK